MKKSVQKKRQGWRLVGQLGWIAFAILTAIYAFPFFLFLVLPITLALGYSSAKIEDGFPTSMTTSSEYHYLPGNVYNTD